MKKHPKLDILVSEEGNIFSLISERYLKTRINTSGYVRVPFNKKEHLVHRLVAETYLNKYKEEYTEVNHKDRNKLNNCVNNIEWCSHMENMRHKMEGIKRGIYYRPNINKWLCQIRTTDITTHLGSYKTKEEAYNVYRETFNEFFGKYPY